jgi:ketosteroid isomerase-like protein
MTESLTPHALIERFLDHVDRGEWMSLPDFYATDAVVEQPFAKPAPIRLVANVQIFRIRDGEIVASRDFHDHAAFGAALAVAP